MTAYHSGQPHASCQKFIAFSGDICNNGSDQYNFAIAVDSPVSQFRKLFRRLLSPVVLVTPRLAHWRVSLPLMATVHCSETTKAKAQSITHETQDSSVPGVVTTYAPASRRVWLRGVEIPSSEENGLCPDCVAAELDRLKAELAFLHGQFQMHSPQMGGEHSWRFMTGWPWTHAKGPNIQDAIRRAMEEVERSKPNIVSESANRMKGERDGTDLRIPRNASEPPVVHQ